MKGQPRIYSAEVLDATSKFDSGGLPVRNTASSAVPRLVQGERRPIFRVEAAGYVCTMPFPLDRVVVFCHFRAAAHPSCLLGILVSGLEKAHGFLDVFVAAPRTIEDEVSVGGELPGESNRG